MAYEQKNNQGAMFRNERKESQTHADWTGNCRIEDHDYWVNCWEKEGAKGKFFSLSFKRKDGTAARPDVVKLSSGKSIPANRVFDNEDEVPF